MNLHSRTIRVAARAAAFVLAAASPIAASTSAMAAGVAPASAAPAVHALSTIPSSLAGGPAHHLVSGAGRGVGTSTTSTNWDGYVALGTDFNAVSAAWVEPAVTCTSQQEYAGFWIGFDGWNNDSVEQGGSSAYCSGGHATYDVWWEMYPYNDIQNSFAIKAGDSMTASVTYSTSTKDFTIAVKDLTSGQSMSKVTACHSDQGGCPRNSAEVISEDIGGGNDTDGLYYLPNYGTATYSGISLTDTAGVTGTLSNSAWSNESINEVSSTGITKQTTGALTSSGAGFTTTWVHV